MKSTSFSSSLPQPEAQLYQKPTSPNRNGYQNGHGVQKPSNNNPVKKIGEEQEDFTGVPVVAINGNTDRKEEEECSLTCDSPSLDGANSNEPALITNGSQQLATPNMPAVHLDSSGSATTSISSELAPPNATSPPITPTPSSMSLTLQQRRHPAQLDLTSRLEVPCSTQSPESSSNSTTPRIPSAVPTITPTATTTSSTPPSTPPQVPVPATPHVYIKIRDFGFPPTDERHLGLGTDIPKANRVHRLNRKLGGPDRARARAAAATAATSTLGTSASASASASAGSRRPESFASVGSVDSSDVDAEKEEDEEDEGWGIGISGWGNGGSKGGGKGWDGFRMGMSRFSWTIGSSSSNIRDVNDTTGNNKNINATHSKGTSSSSNSNGTFPSRKDLDMNFMDSSSSSSDDDLQRGPTTTAEYTEEFMDCDDSDDFDPDGVQKPVVDDEGGGERQQLEPLYPGLYRALYAFEPEGTAEMKLDEDQIVRVIGRGGGVGWAVVVDERGSSSLHNGDGGGDGDGGGGGGIVAMPLKHALVPEGYLEAVRLDWEEEEEVEGLEVVGDGDGDVKVVDA